MKRLDPFGLIGFGLASVLAVTSGWSLQELCWSTWLAGLVYAWACVATGSIEIILTARSRKAGYERHLPFLRQVPATVFLGAVVATIVPLAVLAFYAYSYLFFFYGLFLSFFAEMEPHALFGRDGFIDSGFFTPVSYLVTHFWPVAAGLLVANWEELFRTDPWRRFVPVTEMMRIHFFVVVMPFLTLLAWMILGESYHPLAIVLLIGLIYLMPGKAPDSDPEAPGAPPASDSGAPGTAAASGAASSGAAEPRVTGGVVTGAPDS